MKYLGGRFISPVFTISFIASVIVCSIAELSGGGGMCLNSDWQLPWLIVYPFSFLGMVVGLGLSAFRTYKYFAHRPDGEPKCEGTKQ
jgi:hypothetical protein